MTQGLPEDFDSLPYQEKVAEMLAFYRRVGYDPVAQEKESRMKALEDSNRQLREEVGDLSERLRVLKQDYQVELAHIRLNLAEYAQQAVVQAMRRETNKKT